MPRSLLPSCSTFDGRVQLAIAHATTNYDMRWVRGKHLINLGVVPPPKTTVPSPNPIARPWSDRLGIQLRKGLTTNGLEVLMSLTHECIRMRGVESLGSLGLHTTRQVPLWVMLSSCGRLHDMNSQPLINRLEPTGSQAPDLLSEQWYPSAFLLGGHIRRIPD